MTGDPETPEVIAYTYRHARLSPLERALLGFAVKLTRSR
jgi:hypothetical protein